MYPFFFFFFFFMFWHNGFLISKDENSVNYISPYAHQHNKASMQHTKNKGTVIPCFQPCIVDKKMCIYKIQ